MKKNILKTVALSALFVFATRAMEEAQKPRSVSLSSQYAPAEDDLELQGRLTAQLKAQIDYAMSLQEAEEKTEDTKKEYEPIGFKILRSSQTKGKVSLALVSTKQPVSVPFKEVEKRKKVYEKVFSGVVQSQASAIQPSKPDSSCEIEKLLNELDASLPPSPSQDFIKIIGELEKLTREGFKKADIFAKNPETDQDFESLLERINEKTDTIYLLKNKCNGETIEHPAISRLQALVNTMSTNTAKLARSNAKLGYNPSFASYKVCIESLQTMLTKIKPLQ